MSAFRLHALPVFLMSGRVAGGAPEGEALSKRLAAADAEPFLAYVEAARGSEDLLSAVQTLKAQVKAHVEGCAHSTARAAAVEGCVCAEMPPSPEAEFELSVELQGLLQKFLEEREDAAEAAAFEAERAREEEEERERALWKAILEKEGPSWAAFR